MTTIESVIERRDDPEPPRVTRTLFVSDCSGGSVELSIDLDGWIVIRQDATLDELDATPVTLMTVLDPAAVAAMLRMVGEARAEIERRGRAVLS